MNSILEELFNAENKYHQDLKKTASFINKMKESGYDISPKHEENLDKTFQDYKAILKFHDQFSPELQSKVFQPEKLLELFERNKAEMKTRYALYVFPLKWSLDIINANSRTFRDFNSEFSLTDELTKAVHWLAAYPQFFGRLARLAKKTNDDENYRIFDSIKTIAKEITESVDNLQKVGKMQKHQRDILKTNEDGSLLRSGEAQIINLMSTRMSVGHKAQGYLFLFEKTLLICQTKLEVDGVNKSYTFLEGFPIDVFESKIRREKEIEISKRESSIQYRLVFDTNEKMLQWMQRFMRVMQANPSLPSTP